MGYAAAGEILRGRDGARSGVLASAGMSRLLQARMSLHPPVGLGLPRFPATIATTKTVTPNRGRNVNEFKAYKGYTVRDQISFLSNPDRLRKPAFAVIDRLDGYLPGEQMLGAAVALVAMCEAVNVSPHELITRAINCMSHADGPFTYHVKAIRDYAANEILRRED